MVYLAPTVGLAPTGLRPTSAGARLSATALLRRASGGGSARAATRGYGRRRLVLFVFVGLLGSLDVQGLRDLGELLIRGAFLVQRRLEQPDGFVLVEQVGPRPQTAVGRHLVVLDLLGGRDQRRVLDVRRFDDVDHVLAFLEQPDHRAAC